MKTYLSKDQLLYTENEDEATVYIALKMMFDKMLTKDKDYVEINFSLKQLHHELSGNYDLSRYEKAKLENGIEGLKRANIIKELDSDGKGEYTIDAIGLAIDTSKESYTVMHRDEIRSIFNLKSKSNFNVLRFAAGLFGTFNSYSKCGWASFSNLTECTGVPERTCCDYFKLLEDNGIIYARHAEQAKRDANGQIKKLSNVYGRPSDKQEIDCFFDERVARLCHDFTIKMNTMRKASLAKNYNKYIKGEYTGDVIKLIQECLTYNKISYIASNGRFKDMSVFKERDIEIAKESLSDYIADSRETEKEKEDKPKKKFGHSGAVNVDDCYLEEDLY